MVVRLEAKSTGANTGTATSVIYDDAIEGPISSVDPVVGDSEKKKLTVLGQTVLVDATSTSFEGVAFADLKVDDVIEVSGFADADNNLINATRVELKGYLTSGNNEVEVRGVISSLFPGTSFKLNGLTIKDIDSATLEDLDQGLAEGQSVEVKGLLTNATTIQAVTIEGEDDDRDSLTSGDGSLSLQGIVTEFNGDVSDFSVNGVPVNASNLDAAITDQLALGIEIEVEGDLESGVLIAEEIEFRAGEAEVKAQVQGLSQNSVTVAFPYNNSGVIELFVDNETRLEDDRDGLESFSLSDLNATDEVSIEAREESNQLVITTLKRVNLEEYGVEGVVQSKTSPTSLNLFGLTFVMDGSASYEINDVSEDASTFFDAITEGTTRVELKDDDGDGDIDEAEL
jgi:hypothetical protein